jgi:hypothetical protein
MVRLLVNIPVRARQTVEQTLQAYGGVLAEPQRPVAWLADTVQADPLPQSLPGRGHGAAPGLRRLPVVGASGCPAALTVAERLRHVRQLVGNALRDL